MGKSDKGEDWKVPAGYNGYDGKITMAELKIAIKENEKDKPETIITNSGEYENKVEINDLGVVLDIKAADGGKEEMKSKKAKNTQSGSTRE